MLFLEDDNGYNHDRWDLRFSRRLLLSCFFFFNFWILVPCWYIGRCKCFGDTFCHHFPGLKWQGRETGDLLVYRTRRARADGREPIRGKEYGTGIRTNRELTVRSQGGAWVGSGLREGNGPLQGSPESVVQPEVLKKSINLLRCDGKKLAVLILQYPQRDA
jgi:hypothetical protein